ncbi:MAG: aminotransferase class V-fold PLP-dependent enzyme [Tychonema bourrellyi B0820]|uniref:Aminotransferase class V-fold PLP-dependent enzyme n=1 Tax=Tychonema bourrellyi FEM_GT703 TaxID=2040638 RepID=A0A2G4EZQ5_9CYAN|nr:aminotransferase class V-fold PLP-dependent enzyme [Tychonema bourrellyi]MDQ2099920.1 aminotransferase class V-fold PLP-dependent enzyme [Tychonema bourrellyi B0820]PHX54990.1 aminotransferase class V-fold PLP-dependent enzyme [Tychonema bourrellyi FEM_GT703]
MNLENWLLDRDITFLNHGSFGACPIPVLEAQTSFREQLEREPLRFLMREFEPLLDHARNELAAFIGTSGDELAFVPNATTGVNAVLRSLSFNPGDELLTTNQEYNACRNTLDFVASRTGANVIVAEVPFPIESPEQVVEAVIKCVSPQTKLVLLDHIVSQTGLIFPIKQLVNELAQRGVDVLVDGSHAPGMIALNLEEIGAAYYTGNCHKWLCAPKGAGFLYVRRDKQDAIRPTTISHGANSPRTDKSRFQLEFDWMGTVDPSAYLCVPVAIDFMGSLLEGGWPELMAKNHALALAGRQILLDKLDLPQPCPDEMVGSMAVIQLKDAKFDAVEMSGIAPLQEALWEIFKIEVPVIPWPDANQQLVRISAQFYNSLPQYEYLAKALVELTSLS